MEMRRLLTYCLLLSLTVQTAFSQAAPQKASYTIQDGRMYIRIEKKIEALSLQQFVQKYDLGDLNLGLVLNSGRLSQLTKDGWRIDVDNSRRLVISKQIGGMDELRNPE